MAVAEVEFVPLFTLTSTATRSTTGTTITYSPDQYWPVGYQDDLTALGGTELVWYTSESRVITDPASAVAVVEGIVGPGGESLGVRLKTTASVSGAGGSASITAAIHYFKAARLNSARWGISTPSIRKRISTFA
jgi:hypothetical protein